MLDAAWLTELLSPYGTPAVRRMFGGQGVYLDGLMVGLVAGGVLYLKTDGETAAAFDAAGLDAFAYTAKGERRVLTSYRRAPAETFDDPDEMRSWIVLARSAAVRAAARRDAPKRRPRRSSV
jgi:DNA transformation protein